MSKETKKTSGTMGKLYNTKACFAGGRNGFTLVEMLSAVAILAILVSIAIVGITGYSNNLKATEMDNTARQIFVAAQNHLAQAKASGEWDAYITQKNKDINDSTSGVIAEKTIGNVMSQPADFIGNPWPGTNQTRYRYVVHEANSSIMLETSVLRYMLPFGAIDEEVRVDGSYIIEYDSLTGSVYGVFYTDNELGVEPDDVANINAGVSGVSGRQATTEGKVIRRDYTEPGSGKRDIIGYYGGAGAWYLQGVPLDKPEIEIKNNEQLKINILDPNFFTEDNGTQISSKIVLKITGQESGAERVVPLIFNPSQLRKAAGSKVETSTTTSEGSIDWKVEYCEVIDSVQTTYFAKYSIVLDDITVEGGHFANILPEFIPGENITINATCTSNYVLCNEVEDNAMTNSLFADRKDIMVGASTEGAVLVSSVRHLQNLEESVSGLPLRTEPVYTTGRGYTISSIVTSVSQKDNINFKGTDYGEGVVKDYSTSKIYDYNQDSKKEVPLNNGAFVPIDNAHLKSYSGNGYRLDNFIINNDAGSAGVFSLVGGAGSSDQVLSVSNLKLENFNVNGGGSSGTLVGIVSNGATLEASHISVINPKVTANSGNAGGLVGNTSTDEEDWEDEIKYCGVYATSAEIYIGDNCGIKATGIDGNAGGLIGNMRGGEVRDCFASVTVEATSGNAGGLIGRVSKAKADSTKKEIKNCYVGGITKTVMVDDSEVARFTADEPKYISVKANGNNDTSGFAGGLIGYAAGRLDVDNCFTACTVVGNNAGGFIGKDNTSGTSHSVYRDCYVAGLTKAISGGTAVTFAQHAGNPTMTNCKYLAGISGNNISDGALAITKTAGVEPISYDNLEQPNSKVDTFVYNCTGGYPFKGVNKTCISVDSEDDAAYYGDWEVPEEQILNKVGWAYKEENVSTGAIGWYAKFAKVEEDNIITSAIYGLEKEKNNYIKDNWKYGLLVEKVFVDSNSNWAEDIISTSSAINTSTSEIAEINGQNYYFFAANISSSNQVITSPTIQLDRNRTVTFFYNPDFAASIEIKGESETSALGSTTESAYQIRTSNQLKNIDGDPNSCYIQTADVELDSNLNERYLYNHYSYNGTYDGNNMSIKLNSNDSDGEDYLGLFSGIGKDGVVKNVNIEGSVTAHNVNDSMGYGSICDINEGTIDNCHVFTNYSINLTRPLSNAEITIMGGIAARCLNTGVISDSSFEGSLKILGCNVTAGGIAGILDGNEADEDKPSISSSYSRGILQRDVSSGEEYTTYYGGLIGMVSDATITNSYANSFLQDVDDNYASLFAYSISNSTITNCHGEEREELISNSALKESDLSFAETSVTSTFINCYALGNGTIENGIQYINEENFKQKEHFSGFNFDPTPTVIWEMIASPPALYPTLINNPEPAS